MNFGHPDWAGFDYRARPNLLEHPWRAGGTPAPTIHRIIVQSQPWWVRWCDV